LIDRGRIDTGLITMKNSPAKRDGVARHRGPITETYGFDLSPIATRHTEFLKLAAKAECELIDRRDHAAPLREASASDVLRQGGASLPSAQARASPQRYSGMRPNNW